MMNLVHLCCLALSASVVSPTAILPGSTSEPVVLHAIRAGADRLVRSQGDDGSFPSRMCEDRIMEHCRPERSLFATALITESLQEIEPILPAGMHAEVSINTALAFLESEREPQHPAWRYWARSDPMHDSVPPDLDDTAVIALLFRNAGRPSSESRALLRTQLDVNGVFRTWMDVDEPPDCVVNLNVLAFLGAETHDRGAACAWLETLVQNGAWRQCSTYYDDPWSFPYALTRAAGKRSECARTLVPPLLKQLHTLPQPEHPLTAALALSTLVSAGRCGKPVPALLSFLLATQGHDGGWSSGAFFRGPGPSWFGSAELTTSIAIRAMALVLTGCAAPDARSHAARPPKGGN